MLADRIQIMREPWAKFDFRNDTLRNELADWLQTTRVDLLVVGPLARIGMEGGGTPDEIQAFVRHVETMQAECDRPPAVLIVHHENRAGQVSGAWEGAVDTLLHVQAQGNGRTRVFWQKVRWSSLLHQTTTNLLWADGESFTVEEREEITEATMADEILAAALELPGASWTTIRKKVTATSQRPQPSVTG
jgi:hypothetical protein